MTIAVHLGRKATNQMTNKQTLVLPYVIYGNTNNIASVVNMYIGPVHEILILIAYAQHPC